MCFKHINSWMITVYDWFVCLFQPLLKMAEQLGHASSETVAITLLNIRNLVSFVVSILLPF